MTKLFLTSQFWRVGDKLTQILPMPAHDMTVAFVPTAADPYDDRHWMDADRQKEVKVLTDNQALIVEGEKATLVEV